MKAVLLNGYGDVDQLEYTDAPEPEPGAGEVLVKLIATSINPIDFKIRSGALRQRFQVNFPTILGRDLSGEVIRGGPGVSKFKPGDRVMGFVENTYAEYVRADADALTLIPEGLDPVQAAALPLVMLTGAQLIEIGVEPRAGEWILVTGAVGGVGRSAVHVGKEHGAKVIAGVRARQKHEAESLHADQVAALDDDQEIASIPEVDAIADTINGETVAKLIPKLKKHGRFAYVMGKADAAQKAGFAPKNVVVQPDSVRLHRLAEEVRDGRFSIPINRRMRLSEIREAQKAAEKGGIGKIILIP